MVTPQICFGQVRHARLRPAENSFDYRVYFLRLPLKAMRMRPAMPSRWFSRNRFNLFSFHDADHGNGTDALDWINGLLHAEGIVDADGEIWLHTFPRVLGFAFKPVSFWFCHRGDGSLRAIVCEVNNTFGERHCYLLGGDSVRFGAELSARKAFHVSPFCAVEGVYRFRFMLAERAGPGYRTGKAHHARVVARIEHDDARGPLLVASLSGQAEPLCDVAALKAFFLYPLLTLAVVVRIHWQALKLWCKRVPFHGKPVPPSKETSR